MSEPKKETVRIVLPPRRDGQPATSTARESAMINLPPKPVPAPLPSAALPSVPSPIAAPKPLTPLKPPMGLKPPTGLKPPSPPSAPMAPKPLSPPAAPSAPSMPKPAAPAAGPAAPTLMPQGELAASPMAPSAPKFAGPAPMAVKPEAKKETAKVAPALAGKPLPQATVQMQKTPVRPAAMPNASSFKVQTIEPAPQAEDSEEEIPMIYAASATALAIVALLVQVWMMM